MQKNILLMRHGEAGTALRDFDRPLTDKGVAQCKKQGMVLERRGIKCSAIVSSPAVRAYASAVAVAEIMNFPVDKIKVIDALYNASEEAILPVIQNFEDVWHTVLLVGHNPGFSFLASALCPEIQANLDVGELYAISFPLLHWSDVMPGLGALAIRFGE